MNKEGTVAKQVWEEKDAAVCKITDSHWQPPGRAEGNTQVLLFSPKTVNLTKHICEGVANSNYKEVSASDYFFRIDGMAPLYVQGRCFL